MHDEHLTLFFSRDKYIRDIHLFRIINQTILDYELSYNNLETRFFPLDFCVHFRWGLYLESSLTTFQDTTSMLKISLQQVAMFSGIGCMRS